MKAFLTLVLAVVAFFFGEVRWVYHVLTKYKAYEEQWWTAYYRQDAAAMTVYGQAEQLAYTDMGQYAPFYWIKNWDRDYLSEVQSLQAGIQ
jgi:hypothetical protein